MNMNEVIYILYGFRCARQSRYEMSNEWLVSLEGVMPVHRTCFLAIDGLLKLAECHLVNYYNCLKNAYQNTRERSRVKAKGVSLISHSLNKRKT